MRASFRRQNKLIGAKWLRNGDEDFPMNMDVGGNSQKQNHGEPGTGGKSGTKISGVNVDRNKPRDNPFQNQAVGGHSSISNLNDLISGDNSVKAGKRSTKIIESKTRRTDTGHVTDLNTELDVGSEDEELSNMDQDISDDSKNGFVAGSEDRARLSS
ncbi:hypothetical protein POM88_043364 [Heracleum sosnowskyi]|uniref:Uncharacterized protein n=1 Tax=Heracleum sosnowskyi TaxID=360622 RepID=A0AAD8M1Z4_9APIA|nr:hypothetical protein POM88_043364 [Heracleum sosnowskyi]